MHTLSYGKAVVTISVSTYARACHASHIATYDILDARNYNPSMQYLQAELRVLPVAAAPGF